MFAVSKMAGWDNDEVAPAKVKPKPKQALEVKPPVKPPPKPKLTNSRHSILNLDD